MSYETDDYLVFNQNIQIKNYENRHIGKKYLRNNSSYFSIFPSIPSFTNTHLLKLGSRKGQSNSKYESIYIIDMKNV